MNEKGSYYFGRALPAGLTGGGISDIIGRWGPAPPDGEGKNEKGKGKTGKASLAAT
jgi:hypothetical protein